jgi:hypothetical protein
VSPQVLSAFFALYKRSWQPLKFDRRIHVFADVLKLLPNICTLRTVSRRKTPTLESEDVRGFFTPRGERIQVENELIRPPIDRLWKGTHAAVRLIHLFVRVVFFCFTCTECESNAERCQFQTATCGQLKGILVTGRETPLRWHTRGRSTRRLIKTCPMTKVINQPESNCLCSLNWDFFSRLGMLGAAVDYDERHPSSGAPSASTLGASTASTPGGDYFGRGGWRGANGHQQG